MTTPREQELLPCSYELTHDLQHKYNNYRKITDKFFKHDNLPKLHEYQDGGYWVYCSCCFARGPKFPDKEDAIKSWNTRYKEPMEKTPEEDISVHGVHIEKDGKRVDPKDFYKPQPPAGSELTREQYLELEKIIDDLRNNHHSTIYYMVVIEEWFRSKGYRMSFASQLQPLDEKKLASIIITQLPINTYRLRLLGIKSAEAEREKSVLLISKIICSKFGHQAIKNRQPYPCTDENNCGCKSGYECIRNNSGQQAAREVPSVDFLWKFIEKLDKDATDDGELCCDAHKLATEIHNLLTAKKG